MKLSIIIPAYNEEDSILRCVPRIIACLKDVKKYEIIIVDDGSSDGTYDKLIAFNHPKIKVIKSARGRLVERDKDP